MEQFQVNSGPNEREDGSKFNVAQAEMRGDRCFAGKKGFYWYDYTKEFAIDESTVTGPFETPELAHKAAIMRLGPNGRKQRLRKPEFAAEALEDTAVHVFAMIHDVENKLIRACLQGRASRERPKPPWL